MSVTVPQIAQPVEKRITWFLEFLEDELSLYPGRFSVMIRMTLTCTIAMWMIMAFRSPNAALGVFFAMALSRENPAATLHSGLQIALSFIIGFIYFLVGLNLFANDPLSHFLFIGVSLFLIFFAMRTVTSYSAASGFSFMIVSSIPLWDQPHAASEHVDSNLWAVFGILLGIGITVALELILKPQAMETDILAGMADRLAAVRNLMQVYLNQQYQESDEAAKRVKQLAMVGVGRLRRSLARSGIRQANQQLESEELNALISIVERLVDISASLGAPRAALTETDKRRLRLISQACTRLQTDMAHGQFPTMQAQDMESGFSPALPLLLELEKTLSLLAQMPKSRQWADDETQQSGFRLSRLFVADAFSNVEHLHFAIKGCLTSMLCYIFYTSVDWPGLSTSMATCVITALSSIGSSRQKQVLRISGAITGGLILGMGAQIFILPHLDSILGFTLLFATVTGIAAWFATSSPRLSYFGLQLALAFDLIMLQSFSIETSLSIGRDRVLGTLLGLVAMWMIFDHLWAKPATQEMRSIFASNLRLLGKLAHTANPEARTSTDAESLREKIHSGFSRLNAEADSILFEFGQARAQHMAVRAYIMNCQSAQATLFFSQLAVNQYRKHLHTDTWPATFKHALAHFIDGLTQTWDTIADQVEQKPSESPAADLAQRLAMLRQEASRHYIKVPGDAMPARVLAILELDEQLVAVSQQLAADVANDSPLAIQTHKSHPT